QPDLGCETDAGAMLFDFGSKELDGRACARATRPELKTGMMRSGIDVSSSPISTDAGEQKRCDSACSNCMDAPRNLVVKVKASAKIVERIINAPKKTA
ncbi:hypothetical protein, partial [Aureimonas sp. SK2]|uniref:hypothetical protein n=1 Tax=Aureimonas sp. SK2 TaxID=3015992 RepID=UPI0024448F02